MGVVSFPPFRLDASEQQLWKGTKLLSVRRKPFAILQYLVANPRRLVTHDELLEGVWRGTVVSESAVRTHLHELRQMLGEGFIETVIGRGYRFTREVQPDGAPDPAPAAAPSPPVGVTDRAMIGRTDELGVLRAALERARTGRRQLVFVTGEPGIGKTTLVDAFLAELAGSDVVGARGQAIEQHSAPEPYRPVIDLIGQLPHSRLGDRAIASLVRYAPTFLSQLPQLVPDAQLADVTRRSGGGSESRMVRELVDAFDAMATDAPMVLALEDLQWSDIATIDLLAALGQRRDPARVLVIATSRRAEAQTVSHPLNRVMRELVARSGATALPLHRLDADDIAGFIAARFPDHALPAPFLAAVESITGGTPLFLGTLLDDLVARDMIVHRDGRWTLGVTIDELAAHRPDSLTQLVDIQVDRLAQAEQRVLEVASLVGHACPTALVAAALEIPVEQADELCDDFARRGLFLRHEGTEDWPDGSQQSCYGFTHGLVQDACAARIAPARRARWHRAIAERLEAGHGDRAHEISMQLASHYERGQANQRAIHFHILAGDRMTSRWALADAWPSYRRALDLLLRTPETRERDVTELRILGGMASAALRSRFHSLESIEQFERMIVLARRLGDTARLVAAMANLSLRYTGLAAYDKAEAINAELVAMIEAGLDPVYLAAANAARAPVLFWRGRLAEATELMEALTRPDAVTEQASGADIFDLASRRVLLRGYLAMARWLGGSPDRGLAEMYGAHEAAIGGDPYMFGMTMTNVGRLHVLRRDPPSKVRDAAAAVLGNAGAVIWHVHATLLLDWVRSVEAPATVPPPDDILGRFRERIKAFPLGAPYASGMIIETLRRTGHVAEARAFVDEMLGVARRTGESVFEPELVRIRGELEEPADRDAALASYREAIALAERNSAWTLALRAATSLARLSGDTAPLAAALARMTDGDEAPDVVDARRLLG
jgi:DNA-binding winged helix-turn-helix (wHTH) protein